MKIFVILADSGSGLKRLFARMARRAICMKGRIYCSGDIIPVTGIDSLKNIFLVVIL